MMTEFNSEDLYQNIFQSSVEGILVADKNGDIMVANPACEQLFGYNSQALTGKNIEILIPQQFKQQHKKLVESYAKNPKTRAISKDLDLKGIKKNGIQFNLDISLSPTIIHGKNMTIAFLRDATKRYEDDSKIRHINNELLAINTSYNTLLNNLQVIVYRCKNDSNWTIEYISKGCKDITGYSQKYFLEGKVSFSQIQLKEDQEQVWNEIRNGIEKKQPFSLNYGIIDKKGNIKYMHELGRGIYDKNGKLEALEGLITDITEKKEIEIELGKSVLKTKALLEAIPDMIFIQDINGKYLEFYFNNLRNSSLQPKKVLGVNMKEVLSPDVYKKIKACHERVISSGKMHIVEYSIQGKKGFEHFEARVVMINEHNLLTILRDVTENKIKDDLLNIRNNALDSASNSIIITEAQQPNTPIIYCNEAFEKITGYTKAEIIGKNCNFLQNNDRDQPAIDIMKKAIVNGESCNVTLRNYKKDGTLFWNDVTITPVHNDEQKLTHFIGVQNDVTHKVTEEDIKAKTQNILELIAQDKPLKVIGEKIIETVEGQLKDGIASIFLLNTELKKLYKLVAPNLPKTFSNYIEGTAISLNECSCGTASFLKEEVIVSQISTSVFWEDYKEIALKNGLKACWAFPILSSANQVLGTLSVYNKFERKPMAKEKEMLLNMTNLASVAIEKHQNITALKESKRELLEYTQKLQEKVEERTKEVMITVKKLVETNLDLEDQILITKQAESNATTSKSIASEIAKNFPNGFIAVMDKNLKIVFADGQALTQLGLKEFSKEGILVDDITVFSEKRKAKINEYTVKTLEGEHLSFEIFYKNRYFAVNTAPLFDENNNISHALHVYNDISEQKLFEFKIQNAFKKEKELGDLKSRFISMASHEFRTPLSAILTSAILIGKQNESGKELKREKYVAQIEKNVKNMVTILNDFLSLSKLEEGKVMPSLERFDLIPFSKNLINEINPTLKPGQIMNFTYTDNEIFATLDIKLLGHIINNLLSNASKYSPESSHINFKIDRNKEYISLSITDKGMGIAEEEQQYIFDRFFRAKNAANIEGTGLGLNIVKNYTELIGGSISFKSQLNIGTTFCIEFPLNPVK